jgi:hypothetical protein
MFWFREVRPLATILLTAVAGGITTYCSVDKHAQRAKEQEVALRTEQFQAEELGKYLALPMRESVYRRAMATYLQAVYFSKGELALHKWATKQIDQVDADTRTRRSILEGKAPELIALQRRRDELVRRRGDLELQLGSTSRLSKEDLNVLESRLKLLSEQLVAATAELQAMRTSFEEETRLSADLRSAAFIEAQRAESIGRCCSALTSEA